MSETREKGEQQLRDEGFDVDELLEACEEYSKILLGGTTAPSLLRKGNPQALRWLIGSVLSIGLEAGVKLERSRVLSEQINDS